MLVWLRVVRARVWLSSRTLARQDGVLALVRTVSASPSSHVVYGTPEATEEARGETKRWLMVPIRYNESQTTRHVGVEIAESEDASSAPRGGSVEIVFFVLASTDSDRNSRTKPRITCVARAVLRLNATDLAAVDGAREVLFTSPLDEEEGSVEIAVQRAPSASTQMGQPSPPWGDGSFSVHWTSSEALERDLAAKERARVEAEQQLLKRLAAAEAQAQRARALRDHAVELIQRKRAAKAIQRMFHAWRRRRRERRRQLRREQEDHKQRRKQALRDRIAERNQRRTQRLIEQWTTHESEEKEDEEGRNGRGGSELSKWMETQREATMAKLKMKLTLLEHEREEKLRAIESADSGHCVRFGDCPSDEEAPSRLLGDGLVHAIQRLHLRK